MFKIKGPPKIVDLCAILITFNITKMRGPPINVCIKMKMRQLR